MNSLTDRQKTILNIIIEEYLNQAKPIGSIIVSKQLTNLGASTIRNEMSKLEEKGFLVTDAFSGRIPTKKYVLEYLEQRQDFEYLKLSNSDLKEYCLKNSKAYFEYVKPEKEIIEMISLQQINEKKILFTITTRTDLIYSKILNISEEVETLTVLKINEILKKIFLNKTLLTLKVEDLSKIFSQYKNTVYFKIINIIFENNIYEEIKEMLFKKINCNNLLLLDLPVKEQKEYFEIITSGYYKNCSIYVKNEQNKIFGIIGVR